MFLLLTCLHGLLFACDCLHESFFDSVHGHAYMYSTLSIHMACYGRGCLLVATSSDVRRCHIALPRCDVATSSDVMCCVVIYRQLLQLICLSENCLVPEMLITYAILGGCKGAFLCLLWHGCHACCRSILVQRSGWYSRCKHLYLPPGSVVL